MRQDPPPGQTEPAPSPDLPATLLDCVPDAFLVLDRQGRLTYLNAAAEQLLGRPRGELHGKILWEQVPEVLKVPLREQCQRAMEQDTPVPLPPLRWLPDQSLLGWLYPADRALILQLHHALTRGAASQRFRCLEEFASKVFLDGPLGLALLGSDDRYIRANPAYCRMVQYTEDELTCLTWRDITPPDDWQALQAAIAGLGQRQDSVHRTEKRYLRKDHQVRWGAVTLSLIHTAVDSQTYRLMTMVEDITERKRLDEERAHLLRSEQSARAEAETANHRKDQFLAMVSHELRTPLTPLLARLELLRRRLDLSPEDRVALDLIQRDVELEARLIDDLLDIAKIARGTLQLALQPVDVHAVIRHAVELCQPALAAKASVITLDLHAPNPIVSGDPARLQQVFWNLIGNAVKYTGRGGRITVHSANTPAGGLRLEITDTGIGIDPATMARIFNAFEQGEQSLTRRFGGLGLGLAICKGLVDLHGGWLSAASEGRGKGATFTVELPARAIPAPAAIPPPEARQRARRRSLRLMLVEDNPDARLLLAKLLTMMGYQVHSAGSVEEAVHLASAQSFDLIISDIGLPDGSGWELMRQLRAIRPTVGIAVSGFGTADDLRRSQDAGFAAHLTKPVDAGRLEQVIEELAKASPRPGAG